MRAPKLVYLDTQDYSKLTDAVAGVRHPELLAVYRELTEAADSGEVQFCFSWVIVSELLQVAASSFGIAQRKAEIVERLCGSRALPNSLWLFKNELLGLVSNAPAEAYARANDVVMSGRWLWEELKEASGTQSFTDPLGGLPWGIRHGTRFLLRFASEDRLRSALQQSPLYLAAVNTPLKPSIIGYFKGRVTGLELMNEVANSYAAPTKLVSHPEVAAPLNGLNKNLREFGLKMMSMVQTFQTQVDEIYARQRVPPPRGLLKGLSREPLKSMWIDLARRPKLISSPPSLVAFVNSRELEAKFDELRFIAFFTEIMGAIFERMGSVAANRQKPRHSDGGDILHALYAPYCSVMRVDAAFGSLAKGTAEKFGCTIVSKLEDLPGALRKVRGIGA